MSNRSLFPLSIVLAVGCASHEGLETPKPRPDPSETSEPEPKPEPEPEPEPEPAKVLAKASISSVQMIEDCPQDDPPPAAEQEPAKDEAPHAAKRGATPKPGAMAQAEEMAAGDSERGWREPCEQSTMQLSFVGQGDDPGKVVIKSVSVLAPGSDDVLSTVKPRLPTAWQSDNYQPWDEVVPAKSDIKASYRISQPDWSGVEKKLGKGSYGPMFILEVTLEIDGEAQVIRSPEFPREMPHVVVT